MRTYFTKKEPIPYAITKKMAIFATVVESTVVANIWVRYEIL